MEDAKTSVALSVDHLKVDRVSIWNSDRTGTLVKLAPLITAFVTAVALLVSTATNAWLSEAGMVERNNTAWRNALEKVSMEDKQAVVGTLEMQTFFGDKEYGKQARAIAAVLLPRVSDPSAFDTALYQMRNGSRSLNELHYATMARTITSSLHNLYVLAKGSRTADQLPPDSSFENFVQHPEAFVQGTAEADWLERAQGETWKLDSVSNILSDSWKQSNTHAIASSMDLSGIIFSGHDFSGIDFRAVDMEGSSFVGSCKVDPQALPSKVLVLCEGRQTNSSNSAKPGA